jgi:hypothetical protein
MKSQRKKLPTLLLVIMVDGIEYECLLSANSSPLRKGPFTLQEDLAGAEDPNSNSGSLTLQLGFIPKVTIAN